MEEQACEAFLQWSLPRLELRWPGYRKVCRLVGKRLKRRLTDLGLIGLSAYRTLLISAPEEWARLDAIGRIPISRFYRDRGTFEVIARQLLPEIAAAVSEGRQRGQMLERRMRLGRGALHIGDGVAILRCARLARAQS
jgi:chemotaxis protein methyltransferase CheR